MHYKLREIQDDMERERQLTRINPFAMFDKILYFLVDLDDRCATLEHGLNEVELKQDD